MKKGFIYIFTLLLAISCGADQPNVGVDSLRPLQSKAIADSEVSGIVKSSRSIKLSSEVAISAIKKVVIAPNRDFIVLDKNGLYQFSESGEYIRTIGSQGRSNREYISLEGISVDYSSNSILLLDGASKVLFFSLDDGEFIKSVKLSGEGKPLRVDDIASGLDGEFFIVSCNMNPKESTTLAPTIYRFNNSGQMVNKYWEVKDCVITFSLVSQGYDNSYTIRPFDSQNIISKIEGGVISPCYYVDFEGAEAPAGAIYNSEGNMDIKGYFGSKYYKYPSMVTQSRDYISMVIAGPKFSSQTSVFNKKSLESYKFTSSDGRTTPINPIVADGEYMYYVFGLYNNNQLSERTDPLTKYIIDEYGFIDEEDNPMLIGIEYCF